MSLVELILWYFQDAVAHIWGVIVVQAVVKICSLLLTEIDMDSWTSLWLTNWTFPSS